MGGVESQKTLQLGIPTIMLGIKLINPRIQRKDDPNNNVKKCISWDNLGRKKSMQNPTWKEWYNVTRKWKHETSSYYWWGMISELYLLIYIQRGHLFDFSNISICLDGTEVCGSESWNDWNHLGLVHRIERLRCWINPTISSILILCGIKLWLSMCNITCATCLTLHGALKITQKTVLWS